MKHTRYNLGFVAINRVKHKQVRSRLCVRKNIANIFTCIISDTMGHNYKYICYTRLLNHSINIPTGRINR